jgi:hypothetical protein
MGPDKPARSLPIGLDSQVLARMDGAHAFLATNDTVTTGGLRSIESLVGHIEERSVVATVTWGMQKAETPAE